MDIWFIYVIKTLLLPVSSLLICCFCGYVYVIKNKGKGGGLLITPLVILFLLSLPVVAIFIAQWQSPYPAVDYSEIKQVKPQAIVVLSGGVDASAQEYGVDVTVNSRTLVRARYGAFLGKKTKLPVLVSGGRLFEKNQASEAGVLASVMRDEFNVPVKWMEMQSRNTAENAFYSQKILARNQVSRIILVTHAIHMRRAVEQFQRVGLAVIPAPTSLFTNAQLNIFSFLPSANALQISSMTIHEWLGSLWYSLKYS